MKYEAPVLTPLPPAIDAIQGTPKIMHTLSESSPGISNEQVAAYADWE